jgi:hypothetical protein
MVYMRFSFVVVTLDYYRSSVSATLLCAGEFVRVKNAGLVVGLLKEVFFKKGLIVFESAEPNLSHIVPKVGTHNHAFPSDRLRARLIRFVGY